MSPPIHIILNQDSRPTTDRAVKSRAFGSKGKQRFRSFETCQLAEGLNAGLAATQDQGMDVMGPFVGVHGLEVQHVANHRVFVRDAVAAEHVTRSSRNLQRLAAVVAFQQRDRLGLECARTLAQADDKNSRVGLIMLRIFGSSALHDFR